MKILITSKHTSDGRIYLILNKKKIYIYKSKILGMMQ